MSENHYQAPSSDVSLTSSEPELPRKKLIPRWIKVFAWLFIAFAVLMPIYIIWAIFTSSDLQISIFGLSYSGPALSLWGMLFIGIFMFYGISAYGLLFGKDWGLVACLANGYIGILLCIVSMVLSAGLHIRLEPIIQIFYLLKLHKIRKQWKTAPVE